MGLSNLILSPRARQLIWWVVGTTPAGGRLVPMDDMLTQRFFNRIGSASSGMARAPRVLNDSGHYNSSRAEAGVLAANHLAPTPPKGSTHYHWRESSKPPPLLCHQRSLKEIGAMANIALPHRVAYEKATSSSGLTSPEMKIGNRHVESRLQKSSTELQILNVCLGFK
ncbi:hypothetical protein AVEN_34856-1 [Araneus ventricosus]|uniref:Uncharacterized protein n=1 Tax=Araneus ventricosus TaxID=182803 RepID=A0A4Y2WVW1_ARAVE|nr:hypothetical protein AVEN_34856-1 [Araneus ventricosus]